MDREYYIIRTGVLFDLDDAQKLRDFIRGRGIYAEIRNSKGELVK